MTTLARTQPGHRGRALTAGALLAIAVVGCTPIPPITTLPGRPSAGRDSTAVPGRPARPQIAVVDSAPSREALAVLSSIPEPLAPAERVPPPEVTPTPEDSSDTGDLPDSAATDTTNEIPVPARTPMLGEIVNPNLMPGSDSSATRPDSARAVAPPPRAGTGAPAVPSAPPRAESAPEPGAACWRVQIMAPKEKAEADRKRSAAESILLVPMVIEREAGLWKIRTRECFTRATADVVRGRAVASGFPGAFPLEVVKR